MTSPAQPAWRKRLKAHGKAIFLVALILAIATSNPSVRGAGDRIQIALPLAGWACAFGTGNGLGYFTRFLGTNIVLHSSKQGLGDADINRRPNGKLAGFPSGHSMAAAFGASAIIRSCVQNAPLLQGLAIGAAGFVGYSRVESRNHDILQVLIGLALGVFGDRVWRSRRGQARLRRIRQRLKAAWQS